MDYLRYARRISTHLYSNIDLIKKLNLCIMQFYLIKKYLKNLNKKRK